VTLQEFSQIFALLAVQLGDTQADEIKIRAFHKALEDLDVELVAMAAQRLGRSALNADGEAWMPKAPEWRAMVGEGGAGTDRGAAGRDSEAADCRRTPAVCGL
jgi:hypothetical protein